MNTVTTLIMIAIMAFMYFNFNKRIKTLEKQHDIEHESLEKLKDFWDKVKEDIKD